MKTLVIHPFDQSTEFLREIYANINCTVLRQAPSSKKELMELIRSHNRIIGLGHGSPNGLFNIGWPGFGTYLLGTSEVPLLRDKDNIYIWCHADRYVKSHSLEGFSSGMFISEVGEAAMYGIRGPEVKSMVEVSNYGFAVTLGRILQEQLEWDHVDCYYQIKNQYLDDSDPVITFNNKAMIFV